MRTQVELDGDKMTVGYSEDLSAVAEYASGLAGINAGDSKDMKLAAIVHPFMIYAYNAKRGITWEEFHADPKHMKNLINDPENAAFRVWKGRV